MRAANEGRDPPRSHIGLVLILIALVCGGSLKSGSTRIVCAQAAGPSWSFTGNLNSSREIHTATLLQNGKVLIAGGYGNGDLNSAELYDPATGTWSSTGNLNTARNFHTATLLPGGEVLVVGGGNCFGSHCFDLNMAELYNPATGAWSSTGNLNAGRWGHTATLLLNGKVLVEGGFGGADSVSYLSSAELYDPTTGTWSNTGNLNTAREGHTETLLPNGKVLVAGGVGNNDEPLSSAELYNPTTGTWSNTRNLNEARFRPTLTLLANGKVLAAGGFAYTDFLGFFHVTNSAELYDPATGIWNLTDNLETGRGRHAATLLPNGKVLVSGGEDDDLTLNSGELFDPVSGTWSVTATLNTARYRHPATLLPNGKVLVPGGAADNTAELYDPGTSSTPNQIDDAQFFVRQHYLDFLNRNADASGLAFWTNEITSCGSDAGCIDAKRINVSAAFFISIEFQETGYLVYRIYKSAYGNLPGAPVPVRLNEFLPDTQAIGQGVVVNTPGWETTLENNKQSFITAFVQRSRFTNALPTSMSPAEFVDKLFANANVVPSTTDRNDAINEFGSAGMTSDTAARARALRRVAENQTLAHQEFNKTFVLMQYFGYLRRNPNDAPDTNFDGYNFWLVKLDQFQGNYASAEMVKAFLVSIEYRQRFGQP